MPISSALYVDLIFIGFVKYVSAFLFFTSVNISLLEKTPEHSNFNFKMQVSELQLLHSNQVDRQAMAENFVGLPY